MLGVWAHDQARAARDAGAEVRVLVLHRIVPPGGDAEAAAARRDARARAPSAATRARRDPGHLRALRLAAAAPRAYGRWGAWAAPVVRRALRRLRQDFAFDLIHAHNAVPAADAVLRTGAPTPLVVSEHGADVFHTAVRHDDGRAAIERAFGAARLVLPTATGSPARRTDLGARHTRVVHLGTDLPRGTRARARPDDARHRRPPRRAQAPRGRAARAVGRCASAPRPALPVIGDGPERGPLERLTRELGWRTA